MEKKRKLKVLSIDGGGIRGIVPAVIMQYIEKQLQQKSGNEHARIADYFDLVVGTSTGGILGCFYLVPSIESSSGVTSRYTATQALELYTQEGYNIFNRSLVRRTRARQVFNATRYKPDHLEKLFQIYLGDLMFHDLLKPCVLTSYNLLTGEAVFFNSHESAAKSKSRKYFARDVVRSSSAAPTFFPPARIANQATGEIMVNVDGGVFANNPSMCAYAEARSSTFEKIGIVHPGAEDILLLSLGTGSMPLNFGNRDPLHANRWGLLSWAQAVPDIMMDGGLDTVNYQIKRLFQSLDAKEDQQNYLRIDVPDTLRYPKNRKKMPYNSDMADASPANIKKLLAAGQKTLVEANTEKEGRHTLDRFIDLLLGSS